MSTRTIVEINHDYAHRIEEEPESFVRDLMRYLGSAGEDNATRLERYGIRLAWQGHHSNKRSVVTEYETKEL